MTATGITATAFPRITRVVLALGVLLAIDTAATAQIKLWTLKGLQPGIRFGSSIVPVGDLDGDGVDEIAIGAPGYDTEEASAAGRTYVIDGVTLEPVYILTGSEPHDQLGGASAATADFDGDLVADFVLASGRSIDDCETTCYPPRLDGRLSVYSGATGAELVRLRGETPGENLGASAAFVPDWNGDGVPEIAYGSTGVTAAGHAEAGRLTVLSGADRSLLLRVDGNATRLQLGSTIAVLGDADSDGRADLAVGAPGFVTSSGGVTVFSGTNEPVRTLRGQSPGDRFGVSIAAVGDLDGDGLPELFVGSPRASDGLGRATVYGSASRYAAAIRSYEAPDPDTQFGSHVADAGDVDGDGIGDHAVGAPLALIDGVRLGALAVFSGASGKPLFAVTGKSPEDRFGLAGKGGFNGPQFSDVLVASPLADPGTRDAAGSVTMIRIATTLDCLRGNVNAAAGTVADVLFANGSIGETRTRRLALDRDTPLVIDVALPPSRDLARFALYAFAGFPDRTTETPQPFGLGIACFDTPYGGDFGLPRIIWNNLGEPLLFGQPTEPSAPAPTRLVDRPQGVGRRARGTIQGFIRDDASAHPQGLSITNAIVLDIR